MMDKELLDCPFCGSSDVGGGSGIVCCYRCKVATGRCATTAEAGELWNRRASPAAAVPGGALPPLPTEKLLRLIAENTGRRINLSLDDLDQYLSVARAAVEADRAQQNQPGRDSALRAEPAGQHALTDQLIAGLNEQALRELWALCAFIGPADQRTTTFAHAAIRVAVEKLDQSEATRCRAEGGDGAPEAGDVSADRAQQGEPVAVMAEVGWKMSNWLFGLSVAQDMPDCWRNTCAELAASWQKVEDRAATKAAASADAPTKPDNFGEEVTRLVNEIRKPISMAWRDSLVEQLIELIDPQGAPAIATPAPDTGIPTAGEVEKAPSMEMLRAGRIALLDGLHDGAQLRKAAHEIATDVYKAMLAAAPSHPSEAKDGEEFYTFKKPDGWINLANPSQSWEEWTREQGAPTTKGWKVGEAKAGEDA